MKDYRKVSELKLWEQNPRSIKASDFERLKKQVKELGQYKPLIITKDNEVIGGNMRLRAYRDLGIDEVWVSVVDPKDDSEKLKYALSDNDRAGYYDDDLVANLSSAYPDFDWSGYAVDLNPPVTLDKVLLGMKEITEDDVPEITEEEVSKLGEVYQLGKHRLMCGSATSKEDVEKLMNGQKAQMVFTDPPYNVDYQGSMNTHSRNTKKGILNDSMSDEGFYAFLHDALENMMNYCTGSFYVCMSSKELPNLKKAFEEVGGHWQSFIIWVKNNFTLSRADCQQQYEPILYGWNSQNKNHFFAGFRDVGNVWYEAKNRIIYQDGKTTIRIGDIKIELEGKVEGKILKRKVKTDIWEYDKPTKSEEHPTMKPVKLCAAAISDSTIEGWSVMDLFGGSGSTLIACEQLDRVCYMMELDPKYVDVIRKRYAKFIGKEDEWEKLSPKI